MMEQESMLSGLNTALNALNKAREKMLNDLTPEQQEKYKRFESDLASLTKNNDLKGIEELKEKYKTEFND